MNDICRKPSILLAMIRNFAERQETSKKARRAASITQVGFSLVVYTFGGRCVLTSLRTPTCSCKHIHCQVERNIQQWTEHRCNREHGAMSLSNSAQWIHVATANIFSISALMDFAPHHSDVYCDLEHFIHTTISWSTHQVQDALMWFLHHLITWD